MNPGETLSPNQGETLTCIRSGRDGGPFVYEVVLEAGFGDSPPMHAHPDDEIVEVKEGVVIFNVEGRDHELRAGDRLVIPAGTMHTFRYGSKTEGVRCVGESGVRFERLVDQFRGGGPSFTRLAQQIMADPEGYRTSRFVHVALTCVALVGRLRGIRPHAV